MDPSNELALSLDSESDAYMLSRCGLFNTTPRINVLLLSEEDAGPHKILHRIAQAFSTHVSDGSLPGSTLLPKPLLLSGMTPLVASGQLAEANNGICLLWQSLSSKHALAVGDALRVRQVSVPLPGSFTDKVTIPITPTVWCIAATQAEKKPAMPFKRGRGWDAQLPPGPATFAKLSPQFAAQFDVVLDCCSPENSEIEAWADDFLGALTDGFSQNTAASAGLALKSHITTSQHMAAPRMTSPAMQLLSGYWNALRAAVGSEGGAAAVRLESAATLAAGAARLFHRQQILPFPDAILAIALCEESLIARGWTSALWGPLKAQMVAGRPLSECLEKLYDQIAVVAKSGGWAWDEAQLHEE